MKVKEEDWHIELNILDLRILGTKREVVNPIFGKTGLTIALNNSRLVISQRILGNLLVARL